ncbi:hypothetical protein HNY73_011218 [Argiope bruennichi]|uniref:Uncharacterized protein n=1 Tax=Argiope bruennichi TaxID=94029 RepID=A0A8T0F616_ARGBR|nr:hypothetical protein HNY73_011218 [Argiope bruennichi]
MPSSPTAFVTSAWPKQESARPVPWPRQESAILLKEDIPSLSSPPIVSQKNQCKLRLLISVRIDNFGKGVP